MRIRFPGGPAHFSSCAPTRPSWLYTLDDRADAAELHAAAVHLASQAPQPMSTQVMEWSHGAWQPML